MRNYLGSVWVNVSELSIWSCCPGRLHVWRKVFDIISEFDETGNRLIQLFENCPSQLFSRDAKLM